MKKRVITFFILAAVLIPVVFFCKTPVMPIFFSMAAALGVYEAHKCVGTEKFRPLMVFSMIDAAFLPILIRFIDPFTGRDIFTGTALASSVLLILIYIAYSMFSDGKLKLSDSLEACSVSIYAAFGFAFLVKLCDSGSAGQWLFYSVFITAWVSDTAAFVFGKLFGKHKLAPKISPKKTWEGAVGGIICNVLFFVAYGLLLNRFEKATVNIIVLIPVAVAASVVSMIGDLVMSHLKREHGIKDFSNLFPGHGGILDRFDSVIACSVVIMLLESFMDIIV
ncbi:MAG: phosphatidate cytidylyltransferase [Clostridia bacterium]|nr:phosphatidate cytidylyltransferase [Clostridia bacterium]